MKTACLLFCFSLQLFAYEIPGVLKSIDIQYENQKVELLVTEAGMTLYTFDVDGPNQSNCHGGCLVAWPALTVTSEQAKLIKEPFALHTRDDGSLHVSFYDKPIYTYIQDKKPGDLKGDGVGGVWHLAIDEDK
jgi:predicted lipoprotein with Yx(FWY)xxD motif